MATLKCNSCGGNISSSARRVQCPHCGELFPFACSQCDRKLRPPFSVFEDERYLSLDTPPLPLCDEHYLRQCPDCEKWFGADENPGYFRCVSCAQIHEAKLAAQPPEVFASTDVPQMNAGGVATQTRSTHAATGAGRTAGNPNTMAIAFAVCAFLVLVGWMMLKH